MQQCYYCGRWFRNLQALRQHLRWCKERAVESNSNEEDVIGRLVYQCVTCGYRTRNAERCPVCGGDTWKQIIEY